MLKRIITMCLIASVLVFFGAASFSGLSFADTVKCQCGPNCQCDHCKTGKGECMCAAGAKGCQCGPNCQCDHCKTGKGECMCKAGKKGCSCGPGCACEHCKTGKGQCMCHSSRAPMKK
jgi:hypothetical protein